MVALLWVGLAVVLGIAEITTLTLALGMTSVGALGAAATAGLGGGLALQLLVFGAVTGTLILGVRPLAQRQLQRGTGRASGVDALVGAQGVVTVAIGTGGGQVKIGSELWSARAALGTLPPGESGSTSGQLAVGTAVLIVSVDGASVSVTPLQID